MSTGTKGAFINATTGVVLAAYIGFDDKPSLQGNIYLQGVIAPTVGKILDVTAYAADNTNVIWLDDPDYMASQVEEAEAVTRYNTQLAGFDYNNTGTMISFTREDRAAISEASILFDKQLPSTLAADGVTVVPSAGPYIPDGQKVPIIFENGTKLSIDRLEFETVLLPAFLPVGLQDLQSV